MIVSLMAGSREPSSASMVDPALRTRKGNGRESLGQSRPLSGPMRFAGRRRTGNRGVIRRRDASGVAVQERAAPRRR